jgi:carboxynorspermidine decarboxylase
MVKKNWFNGVKMPAIAVKGLDGVIRIARDFTYDDYEQSLS